MWLMLGIPKLHIFVNTHLMKIQSIENTLATVGKQMGGGGGGSIAIPKSYKR